MEITDTQDIEQVKTLIKNNHSSKAEQIINQNLTRQPNSATLHHLKSLVYLKQQIFVQSKRWLEKAITLDNKNADYFCDLGVINLKIKENDAAIQAFKQAI